MKTHNNMDPQRVARIAGWSIFGTIIVGICTSIFVSTGIDVNLSADIAATAENMLDAKLRLRAKAYLGALSFGLASVTSVAFWLLLRRHQPLLTGVSFILSITGAALALFGAVYAMNAAEIASHPSFSKITNDTQRLMLTGMQATSDYTSFHLGLVIGTLGNAGFFYAFFKSKLLPSIIAAWGVFASVYVVTIIILRDFVPVLGNDLITMMFMLCNLSALVATAIYLSFKGVRIAS